MLYKKQVQLSTSYLKNVKKTTFGLLTHILSHSDYYKKGYTEYESNFDELIKAGYLFRVAVKEGIQGGVNS